MKKQTEIAILIDKIKESGISIRKLAKKLGIPEQRMYGWTNKGSVPGYEDIKKLKDYFGYNPHNLNDEEIGYGKTTMADKVKSHDALLSVLVHELAALLSRHSGEPVHSIVKKLYKAAEDAGDDLPG